MLELFREDAELRFVGVPVGPFAGVDEIARAFEHDPPTDLLELVPGVTSEDADSIRAEYGWAERRGEASGTLTLQSKKPRRRL